MCDHAGPFERDRLLVIFGSSEAAGGHVVAHQEHASENYDRVGLDHPDHGKYLNGNSINDYYDGSRVVRHNCSVVARRCRKLYGPRQCGK
jgi:hypothetical protein